MGSEEAKVVLTAVDNVTIPALKASESLRAYQGSVDALASLTGGSASGINPAYAKTLDNVSDSATHAGTSHRVAHQSLQLFTQGLGEVAGASPAAEAGVRVLDSAMLHMATTGGMLSLGFVAVVAAVTAAGYAFRTSAEHTKTEREEMDKLKDSTIAAVKQLDYLDRAQKSVMGVGAGEAAERVTKLKAKIDDLTEAMRKNAAQAAIMSKPQTENLGGMEGSVTLPAQSDGSKSAGNQVKMAGELRVLQEELKKAQHEQDQLTLKSSKYVSLLKDNGNPLRTYSNELERQAAAYESVGQIMGDLEFDYGALSQAAETAGISTTHAAQIMVAQNKAVEQGVFNLASAFGQTIGNAVMKGKDAWREGLKAMLGMVFDTATQVLIAAAIMNKGLSAALIPFSFGAILAMVAVVQGLKMVAMNALSSGAASLQSAAPTSLGAVNGGATSGTGTASSGPGGSPISSASKEVVNNIQIHLPVSAMDLSSVSDIQMKTLANKIGRIIADAAGHGQFSLVGA